MTLASQQQVPLRKVTTLSGHTIEVQGDLERKYYQQLQKKYMEFRFTNASDLQDLERLIFLELMIFRATAWLSSGRNYYGELLTAGEEVELRRTIKVNSPLISEIKNDLGLTKSQRDKADYESVAAYIVKLKARATEMGIHRETQLRTGLCVLEDISAVIGAFDRSDQIEREKLGFTDEKEIVDWIRDMKIPEYREVDEYFRNRPDGQRYWVRTI